MMPTIDNLSSYQHFLRQPQSANCNNHFQIAKSPIQHKPRFKNNAIILRKHPKSSEKSAFNSTLHSLSYIQFSHNNMNRSLSFIPPLIHRLKHRFGSYYAATKLFAELQNIQGNINKRKAITNFRAQLSPDDKEEFNKLIDFVNSKPKIGISSKIVNKYYIKTFVPTSEAPAMQPQLAHGGLMTMICNKDKESELSLYDVNLFIQFLTVHTGNGSQTVKSKLIIDLAPAISQQQGHYLMKLIDRNLPIGATIKTFTKAAIEQTIN